MSQQGGAVAAELLGTSGQGSAVLGCSCAPLDDVNGYWVWLWDHTVGRSHEVSQRGQGRAPRRGFGADEGTLTEEDLLPHSSGGGNVPDAVLRVSKSGLGWKETYTSSSSNPSHGQGCLPLGKV